MPKRYFEDLVEGEKPDCADVAFTRNDIIEFAWRFDPQAFHTDENAAKKSAFGGLIASSLHTLAACIRVVVEAQGNMAILSGIGMHEVKMFNPVRPGDVLCVEARWCELKPSASKPSRGLASIKCKVVNQNGEAVIAYGYRYLLACRGEKCCNKVQR
ncbi:MaoC/PaaZ C-terminal domain-containing protein [Desulfococcaceae bacterium HSG7]|nr:MaoC/PaaZ C-terminal domain-containing protein [Desulfococcaceae bacterium HSG7]